MNKRIVTATYLLALLPAISQTSTPTVQEYLDKMNTTFEENLVEIRSNDRANRIKLAQQYHQRLTALANQYKQTGSLEPLLAVRNELERFTATPTLVQVAPPPGAPELEHLMTGYAKMFADNKLSTSRAVHTLIGKYDKSLETLQGKYTRLDRIEEAVAVKNRRTELTELEFVREATAVVEADNAKRQALAQQRAQRQREQAVTRPAPGQVPNKFKGSDKKRIADRYDDFIDSLVDDDMDALVTLMNPIKIEKSGTAIVKGMFKPFAPAVKVAEELGVDFRTGKITFAEDGQSAVQIPLNAGPNKHKDGDPVKWIKVEGDWYIDL